MSIVQKLTDDEISLLLNLQKQFNELTRRYGELHYQKKVADAELALADKALDDIDTTRYQLIKQLQDKYGVGQINIATGEFLPEKN